MKKYISILLAAVLVLACLSACGTSDKPADADNSEKLSVVTTIFPQYDFTRQIVGDKADVTMLLKPGAESHSYEPTPQDIKTIQNCDLFIYTGGENDVWVDDILNSMGDQRPDTLRLIDCVPTVNEEIVEGMEHEHDHDHGEIVESEIKTARFLILPEIFNRCFPTLRMERWTSISQKKPKKMRNPLMK